MSPAHTPRHLLVWSLPTIVVLLSFLWYKKRKAGIRSEPGGIDPSTSTRLSEPVPAPEPEPEVKIITEAASEYVVPTASKPVTYSRSLSGKDSAPIDIKSARSTPLVISDKELDLEIEKIKSMKAGVSLKKQMSQMSAKRRSPKVSTVTPGSHGNSGGSIEADEEMHARGHSVDRDSANHSPADVMMPVSPSLSSISDNHSDSDSGKGGSDVATPPPVQQQEQIEGGTTSAVASADIVDVDISVYEFVIAQQLVGRLIGRHGTFVHYIREKTNARILIKRHPETGSKLKVCAIEGTQVEVDAALALIRDKFPVKRYPDLSLERVSFVPIVPDCMHLRLIEGVNNDTIVSCVVTPSHLFLQQPTHPTFPSLNVLTDYMNACYADTPGQIPPPLLPAPVLPGTICAAQSSDVWYRVSIMSSDDEASTAYVQFLDYGGYATVPCAALRQIRGDFLLLPFQAAECLLANIEPADGTESEEDEGASWCQEAYDTVVELTRSAVVFTQVVDYMEEDGVTPLVHIYVRAGTGQRGVLLLNRELVERGFARWIDHTACSAR